jgi:hypothetical protein
MKQRQQPRLDGPVGLADKEAWRRVVNEAKTHQEL